MSENRRTLTYAERRVLEDLLIAHTVADFEDVTKRAWARGWSAARVAEESLIEHAKAGHVVRLAQALGLTLVQEEPVSISHIRRLEELEARLDALERSVYGGSAVSIETED